MKISGTVVVRGRVEGTVLASDRPLSLLGGVDNETGVVKDPESPLKGKSLAGRILALPSGKGSTVGSYVLYSLRKRGVAPVGILAGAAETILAVGAVLADVPMLGGVDVGILRTGDRASWDADESTRAVQVDLPDLVLRPVVTAFLEREDGRILLVRRSGKVGSFRGKWSAISGFVEPGEAAEDRARREVEEETGLRALSLLAAGSRVVARGEENVAYDVRPVAFRAPPGEVRLNWENEEFRWVTPAEIPTMDTVPRLLLAWHMCELAW